MSVLQCVPCFFCPASDAFASGSGALPVLCKIKFIFDSDLFLRPRCILSWCSGKIQSR